MKTNLFDEVGYRFNRRRMKWAHFFSLLLRPLIYIYPSLILTFIIDICTEGMMTNNVNLRDTRYGWCFFIIWVLLGLGRWLLNRYTLQNIFNQLLDTYDAQHLLPSQSYHEFFDVLDEICVGFGIERPMVYLVNSNENMNSVNLLGLQMNGQQVLLITPKLIQVCSRYELEALLAVELGYTQNLYNTFLIYRYVMYTPIRYFMNVLINLMWLFGLTILFSFPMVITFVVLWILRELSFKWLQNQNRTMIKTVNKNAVQLTNNPDILIAALQKLNDIGLQGPELITQLWLDPIKIVYKYKHHELIRNIYRVNLFQVFGWQQQYRLRTPIADQIKMIQQLTNA